MDEPKAFKIIKQHGGSIEKGIITLPSSFKNNNELWDAIDYLCNEFDYALNIYDPEDNIENES